jgi:hypothetical protein
MSEVRHGASFEYRGKGYILPRIDRGDKKQWLIWCNAFARRQLAQDRLAVQYGWLDYAEFQQAESEIQDKCATRYYHFDARGAIAMLENTEAYTALAWICLSRVQPELTLAFVTEMIGEMGMAAFSELWREANANPTPAPASAGESQNTIQKPSEESSSPSSGTDSGSPTSTV